MNHMKWLWLCLTIFGLAGVTQATSHLTLGVEDGLAEECEVRNYDVKTGIVTLRGESASTNRPFNSFPTDTQQKIIGWATGKAFSSSSGLSIRMTPRETKKNERTKSVTCVPCFVGMVSTIYYDMVIENRAPFPMQEISVTCKIFYFQNDSDRNNQSGFSMSLAPGEKRIVQTPSISLRNGNNVHLERQFGMLGSIDYVKVKAGQSGHLEGILVNMSMPGFDGNPVSRTVKNGQIPKDKN
ncbi:MAG: hypothetical protein PHP93_00130 [Kiritimatiellales bacterium]|nr:hypothetical protein [Kiritimatiellales bacterium]